MDIMSGLVRFDSKGLKAAWPTRAEAAELWRLFETEMIRGMSESRTRKISGDCLGQKLPNLEAFSERNAFNNVAGDFFLASVVKPGGPRVRMTGQELNVFQSYPVREKIGDGSDAETVRRKAVGQPGIMKSTFYHAADVDAGNWITRQHSGSSQTTAK